MTRGPIDPNDALDQLITHRLRRSSSVPPAEAASEPAAPCVDAATLASYVDGELTAEERAQWEAHFAICAICRRTLRVMTLAASDADVAVVGPALAAESAVVGTPAGQTGEAPHVGSFTAAVARRDSSVEPVEQSQTQEPSVKPRAPLRRARVWLPLAASLVVGAGLWLTMRSGLEAPSRQVPAETTIAADTARTPASEPLNAATASAPDAATAGVVPGTRPAPPAPRAYAQPKQEAAPLTAAKRAEEGAFDRSAAALSARAREDASLARAKGAPGQQGFAAGAAPTASAAGAPASAAVANSNAAAAASAPAPAPALALAEARRAAPPPAAAAPAPASSAPAHTARDASAARPAGSPNVAPAPALAQAAPARGATSQVASAERDANAAPPTENKAAAPATIAAARAAAAQADAQAAPAQRAPAATSRVASTERNANAAPPTENKAAAPATIATARAVREEKETASTATAPGAPAAPAPAHAKAAPAGVAESAVAKKAEPTAPRAADPTTAARDDRDAAAAGGARKTAAAGQASGQTSGQRGNVSGGMSGAGGAAMRLTAPATTVSSPDGARIWRLLPGAIESSADRGVRWQLELADRSLRLIAGSAPSSSICWVAGANGIVLRRAPDGQWRRTESAPALADLTSITATSDTQATVTTADHRTFRTQDAGRTWQLLPPPSSIPPTPPRP